MRKLAVLVLILGLAAIEVPAANAGTSRPFHGSADGSVAFVPGTECQNYGGQNVRTDGSATGTASHLGRMTLTTSHCSPEGPEFAGEATLAAANRDEVYIEYAGVNAPPDPDTSVIVSTADFTIVGGSGQFEDAEGGGVLTAFVLFEGLDDPEWPASWMWQGTIDY